MMQVVGLDIGGANVKAADVDGRATTQAFALWKTPDQLPDMLRQVISRFQNVDVLSVTMTAELADCFETKAEGVDFVLRSVEEAAASIPVFVWQTGAEFVRPDVAREIPPLVAAANWHALATWSGRAVPGATAVMIDVGSTTTDVVPLHRGVPVPSGMTDCERLQSGELIYSGVRRTPLCAIAHSVPFRDGYCPLAAELFATTLDVYLTLGEIAENADDNDTANGRAATRTAALDRLARTLCCDRTEFTADDADVMVRFLKSVQLQRITGGLDRVLRNLPERCTHVLISGSGAFVARRIVEEHAKLSPLPVTSLAEMFSPETSQAACAFAVARLAAERLPGAI